MTTLPFVAFAPLLSGNGALFRRPSGSSADRDDFHRRLLQHAPEPVLTGRRHLLVLILGDGPRYSSRRRYRLPALGIRRQKTFAVNIPYRGSEGPLHLLIESTGIKVEGEGEWHARKHGASKRRVWRKIHLAVYEETLEVRAVEITGRHVDDATVWPDLLGQIPADEPIGGVTTDGTYDTRKCDGAMASVAPDVRLLLSSMSYSPSVGK